MKPFWIKDTFECEWCLPKLMKLERFFLRDDESAVEVWYRCEKHGLFGLAYSGKFIENFKKQDKIAENARPNLFKENIYENEDKTDIKKHEKEGNGND
jgi:hypothetical protein